MTAQDIFRFRGNTPHFDTFGEEGDISNIYQFVWYEWVYFHEASAAFSLSSHLLGRCLGPAMNERNEMSQWVLKLNRDIVTRKNLSKLTTDELVCESEVKKRADFDAAIKKQYGYSFTLHTPCKLNPQDTDDTHDLIFMR